MLYAIDLLEALNGVAWYPRCCSSTSRARCALCRRWRPPDPSCASGGGYCRTPTGRPKRRGAGRRGADAGRDTGRARGRADAALPRRPRPAGGHGGRGYAFRQRARRRRRRGRDSARAPRLGRARTGSRVGARWRPPSVSRQRSPPLAARPADVRLGPRRRTRGDPQRRRARRPRRPASAAARVAPATPLPHDAARDVSCPVARAWSRRSGTTWRSRRRTWRSGAGSRRRSPESRRRGRWTCSSQPRARRREGPRRGPDRPRAAPPRASHPGGRAGPSRGTNPGGSAPGPPLLEPSVSTSCATRGRRRCSIGPSRSDGSRSVDRAYRLLGLIFPCGTWPWRAAEWRVTRARTRGRRVPRQPVGGRSAAG